jgi:Inner membrane component of T3SS, cytoplasmic domain/Domain of unknown function (DUF1707)
MRAAKDQLADDREAIRVSDADRDQAIGRLRHRFVEGRLSHDTFLVRMDAALAAKEPADLVELFTDLPDSREPASPAAPGLLDRLRSLLGLRPRDHGWGAGQFPPTGLFPAAGYQRPGPVAADGMVAAVMPPPPLWLPPQADGRFTIGRAMECDFTLADLSVSRWHARLYRKDDGWMLSDLGSTNGTRLNGWRVTTGVPVRPGDTVSFGSVSFVISDRTEQ